MKIRSTFIAGFILIIFFLHPFFVQARESISDPTKVLDLGAIPKAICLVMPGCDASKDGSNVTPTPKLGPTDIPLPSGQPLPTTNPSITPPSGKCMPPGGPITCGTRNTPLPKSNPRCGHCGLGYARTSYCYVPPALVQPKKDTNGNAEAIDIGHRALVSVPLPFIKGYKVIWYHSIEGSYRGDPSAYQEYDGIAENKKTYKIRYLHTQKGSGAPLRTKAESGQEGAKVAINWLRADGQIINGNHIHIQIYDTEVNNWVDATNFYCH